MYVYLLTIPAVVILPIEVIYSKKVGCLGIYVGRYVSCLMSHMSHRISDPGCIAVEFYTKAM